MDFIGIGIGIDKDEIWKVFSRPQSIYSNVIDPSKFEASSHYIKLVNFDCTGPLNNDTCAADSPSWMNLTNSVRITSGTQVSPGSSLPGGDAPGDSNADGAGQDEEPKYASCEMEQIAERERDNVAQAAADEINSKDPKLEHATFGVRDGNSIVTVLVSTGDSETADVVSLYTALRANGYDMSDVVFFIHSHPSSTITDASWAATEDFANQFPSDNDLDTYAEFLEDAVEDGANAAAWVSDFSAYIVGPDNVNREYGNFTLDGSGASVSSPDVEEINVHPEPGSNEYQQVQESADRAEADAANGCE